MIRLFKQYCSLQGLFFFLGESLTILAGVLIYTSIHIYSATSPAHTFSFGLLLKLGFVVLTCQIVFHYMELYKSTTMKQPDVFFFKILQSLGVVAIIFSLFTLLSPGIIGLQGNPLSLICFVGFLVLVWRFLGIYWVRHGEVEKGRQAMERADQLEQLQTGNLPPVSAPPDTTNIPPGLF